MRNNKNKHSDGVSCSACNSFFLKNTVQTKVPSWDKVYTSKVHFFLPALCPKYSQDIAVWFYRPNNLTKMTSLNIFLLEWWSAVVVEFTGLVNCNDHFLKVSIQHIKYSNALVNIWRMSQICETMSRKILSEILHHYVTLFFIGWFCECTYM